MNKQTQSMSKPSAQMVRLGDGAYITVFMNNESLTLRQADEAANFQLALTALKDENWDALYAAMRPVKSFVQKVDGVTIEKTGVFFNGKLLHNVLSKRIMDFATAGLDHKPLCKFLSKLMANPSKRAVDELYTFLEHQNLPITENGNILAYKAVQSDWYSVTSGKVTLLQGKSKDGKIFNGVGEVIEIPRNEVDDNKDIGCSYGLHAGTLEYAKNFHRGKLIIVEIDPSSVVSIPTDCQCQKMRCCKYKVVKEFTEALDSPLYKSSWKSDDDDADSCGDDCGDDCCGGSCECCDEPTVEIAFETPGSSWLELVEWHSDGSLWLYGPIEPIQLLNVPIGVAEDFEDAVNNGDSAGQWYHRNLKRVYTSA